MRSNWQPKKDNARRHHAWLQNSSQDHPHLQRLHRLYDFVAEQAFRLLPVQKLLDDVCGPIVALRKVTLYYSCDHFGQCFPLNHFHVLLILKWAKSRSLPIAAVEQVKLEDVAGVGTHVYKGLKTDCHRSAHSIQLVPVLSCGQSGGTAKVVLADIVIVRLGNNPTLNFDLFEGRSIPRTRQLMPYTPPL